MNKMKYILDEEINLFENDLLGTSSYVETIEKILQDCPSPYTIGIFGSWGSGKSSIIKTLKEKYNNGNQEIRIFIYDAWKYSNDDFRRTFILELANFIDHNYKKKIMPKLYQSKSTSTKFGLSSLPKILTYERTNIFNSTPIVQPELFEEIFEEIIKEKKCKKLVISIDNIDRCHKEQVLEILLTIKTFLGENVVIFLIPIDNKRLRQYLPNANEFLRKLFNTSIQLRSFSNNELFDYGMELFKKYQIDIPKKEIVISLIAQEYSKNPRRIIQFLNILQTEYYLAQVQEQKGYIQSGSITNNIEMLVKLLIIREEYPTIYETIQDKKEFIKEVSEAISMQKFSKTDDVFWEYKSSNNPEIRKTKFTEEQYRFFRRTSNIVMDSASLEPFFINRDIFKDIPDKIYNLIIEQDWDELKKFVDSSEIKLENLINLIDNKINEYIIKRKLYDTYGFNLFSLIFKILKSKGNEISDLPQYTISVLNSDEIYKNIYNFPSQEFIFSLSWFNKKGISAPIDNTIKKLNKLSIDEVNNNNTNSNFLKEFIKIFEKEHDILSRIKDKFSELLSKNFNLYSEFEEIIKNETVKYLLNDDFAREIIPTVQQNYDQNQTKEKVEIIKALNKYSVLTDETVSKYLNQVAQLVNLPQNYQNWSILNFWLEAIIGFVVKIRDQGVINNVFNAMNQTYNFIFQQFSNKQFTLVYIPYSSVISELYLVTSDNTQNQNIVNWLNNFHIQSVNTSSDELFHNIVKIYQNIIEKTDNWLFTQNVINLLENEISVDKKNSIAETVNMMIKKNKGNLNAQQKKQIIEHYFQSLFNDEQKAEKWLLEIINNLTDETMNYILSIQEAIKLNKAMNIIKQIINKKDFNEFYPKIKEMLASSNSNEQVFAIQLLSNIKEKIPQDKIKIIYQLLSDIDKNKLPDEERLNFLNLTDYLGKNRK